MIHSLPRRVHSILLLALLGLLAIGGTVTPADARQPVPVPTLVDVSATTQTPTLVTVVGTDFTPGGRVYLAIYDQMGATLYEFRWVTASYASVYEPYWGEGQYGGTITTRGGELREAFAGLCRATTMMRALDEDSDTWSTWLEVAPNCTDADDVVLESTTP